MKKWEAAEVVYGVVVIGAWAWGLAECLSQGEYVWAAVLAIVMGLLLSWLVKDIRAFRPRFPRSKAITDVPLPPYTVRGDQRLDVFTRGFEPVETPSDAVPVSWEDHDRDCDICRKRFLG